MELNNKQNPWNKGLTKETDERVKNISLKHLGKKVSEKSRGRMSVTKKRLYKKGILTAHNKNKTYEEEYGMEKAKSLKANLSKIGTRTFNFEINRDLGYFIGLILGDGTIIKTKTHNHRITIKTTNEELVHIFKQVIQKIFPLKVYTYKYMQKSVFKNHNPSTYLLECYTATIDSKIVYDMLRPLKLDDFHFKVPSFLNTEATIGFLQGFFDAEGTATISSNQIEMTSKHGDNLEQIQKLLSEFNIESKIYDCRKSMSGFRLHVTKKDSRRAFYKLIGSRIQNKLNKLKMLAHSCQVCGAKDTALAVCRKCGSDVCVDKCLRWSQDQNTKEWHHICILCAKEGKS